MPTIIASVTMNGCMRVLAMTTPENAPTHRPTAGTANSTPSTPNFSGTCATVQNPTSAAAIAPAPSDPARRSGCDSAGAAIVRAAAPTNQATSRKGRAISMGTAVVEPLVQPGSVSSMAHTTVPSASTDPTDK